MNWAFLPEAEQELRESARFYEEKASGVGISFIAEIHKAVAFIGQNPYSAKDIGSGIRKKVLNLYPYNILYSIEAGSILIIAVAHQKRRPNYRGVRTERLKNQRNRKKK